MNATDVQEELSESEFSTRWRGHFESVFVDNDIDKMPFRKTDWFQFCVGAPAYYFDGGEARDAKQAKHRDLYSGLEATIAEMGDTEIAGFLRRGPHPHPSMFRGMKPFALAMYQMRFRAVDGFDLNIFARSETWGVVISWEEEISLIGGSAEFAATFERLVGGRAAICEDFESATAYLHDIGDEQRQLVARLRTACYP